MPYAYATREQIARTPSLFADTVAGALGTHALYRMRNLPVGTGEGTQSQESYDLAEAICADPEPYLRPTLRIILHSAEQAGLEDVTALTDPQVLTMIETIWPLLVTIAPLVQEA